MIGKPLGKMKSLTRNFNLLMLAIGILLILSGSAYAMTQVTRAVPASVTVEVMHGVVAEPILRPFQDPVDGATGVSLGIARVYDSSNGEDVAAPLASFQSTLSYDSSCANILGIRPLDFTATALDIDNASGMTTFDGIAAPPVATPSNLYQAVARLVGSNQVPCAVAVELNSLLDGAGNPVLAPDTSIQNLRRGDARADGVIDVADALFIAQYLAGLRPACTPPEDTACLHSVNAASVRQDGAFDKKTIADARYIAQHLMGRRDEFYNPVP
jgi:hypothetical protein